MEAPGELVAAAESTEWKTRVDAARRLPAFLHDERARWALLRLLTDRTDSAPAVAAAETLLREGSDHALRLFAVGWDLADDELGDDLASELLVVHRSGRLSSARWRGLLAAAEDGDVRRGIVSILKWLGA